MVGRPSGEPLDLEMPGPVAQDVVEVDPRGRVLLPPRIVADIGWLDNLPEGGAQSLAVLDRPRILRLLSFDQTGVAVLARRRELIAMVDSEPEALEELVLLEDRYHRIRISQDRRVTLSNLLVAHLEIRPGETALYIERVGQEVRLISPAARSQRLISTPKELKGLP